ncbi:MAG: hypothetical protein KC590_05590 [Nitrospira sp.]|nr:hypothetical protein [Nitrospira sp.]
MRYLLLCAVFCLSILSTPSFGLASKPDVPSTIETFVSQLYPKNSHYFWIINNTTTESTQELVVDILTTMRKTPDTQPEESRFLLLFIKGKLFAAQKIPLEAEVDCGNDEEI